MGLHSCGLAPSGANKGQMGDLAGDEPEVGGISDVPNPNSEMASKSGTPLGRLQRGHEVYMLKCGECHAYMLPKAIDEDRWERKLPKMITHAGLGQTEEQAVLEYVIAVRKSGG
jgi:cytochrome c5